MVITDHVQAMIVTHPQSIREPKQEAMINAIQSCFDCAQACVTCSDACLGEQKPELLRSTIRSTQDSADICLATAKVLSRLNTPNFEVLRNQVRSCITSVRVAGMECDQHAQHHEHCRICAESCRNCESALDGYQQYIA